MARLRPGHFFLRLHNGQAGRLGLRLIGFPVTDLIMPIYRAPVEDYRFLFNEVLELESTAICRSSRIYPRSWSTTFCETRENSAKRFSNR